MIKSYKIDSDLKKITIFAVIIGVIVGILCSIPLFVNTSFSDIGVYLDWWIVFAIYICLNAKSYQDAAIKCFIFFLISQPIIYLVQVPFQGFSIFRYYLNWIVPTIAVIPGAMICYLVSKKNWLSVLVLSVATCYLASFSIIYLTMAIHNFPRHILSFIINIIFSFGLVFKYLDSNKHRLVACILIVISLVTTIFVTGLGLKMISKSITLDGDYDIAIVDNSVVDVTKDGNVYTFNPIKDGETDVIFTSDNGETITYVITVSKGNVILSILN